MIFQTNTSYIVIRIDDFMAMSSRTIITITRELNGRAVFKQKGKRKEFYAPNSESDAVLYFPVNADTEQLRVDTDGGGSMRGNACFNFTSPNPDLLRQTIEKHCLNLTDEKKAHCTYCIQDGSFKDKMLYHNAPTSSSRIREMQNR